MIGKNNHYLRDTKDGTKVESYSIKKFKVGAASVVIGASIFLGAGAVAQASEEVSNNTTADNTTNAGAKENVPTAPVATAQPVAKETTKEDVAAGLAVKLGGEVKALDKTKLESYIAEIEGKLADGTYANKTEESVAVLKEELKAAKATLVDATTQDEIIKAYSKLVTTANTKLKAKPVEKKETPAVDTTNGKETVGKKAENTEKKSESNSIENTGSKDSRNGKALDKNNAFRAETTATQGTFTYSMEYSNGKEIYLYNEEEADVNITVNSTAGKIKRATVKAGSGQFVLKSKSDQAIAYAKGQGGVKPEEEEVEIDGYGWSYHQTLTETQGPVTIKITGKPNDTFKGIKTYTKTEDQRAVLGARYLELEDSNGNKLAGGSNLNAPGAFNLVVKSQTYKYDIQQPESNADKVAVSNVDSLTEADITKIKNEIKIKYSDKATTEDARLASKKGEVVNPRSSVVKEIAVANGTVTVTYNDDSVDTAPVSSVARTNQAPTVSIQYSDPKPSLKEVYLYNGEEADVDITFNDDLGKIKSAALKQGGNRALSEVDGNPDKQDNQFGYTVTAINSETPTPAKIKVTGQVSGIAANKLPKTETDSLKLVTRFATATDTDGAFIENDANRKEDPVTKEAVGTYLTDPGAVTFVLKAQTKKYDIKTPASADKVTVSDANNVTEAEFDKIKEKVKLEYSQKNNDERLADKKGQLVDNQTERIESITRNGNDVVVTYKDGSKDAKALADFVNVAPKVELPYSNKTEKQIYVYTGENTDLTFKGTDENEVKDLYLRGPGDVKENNANKYGFTTGKVENGEVTGEGSVSEDKTSATIKMTGVTNLRAGQQWTSFIVSKDNDGKLSNTDYRALDVDPNTKEKPGYVRFVVKNQTSKYDIAAPTEKVAVTDPANVTEDDLAKIKEKLQLEYNKNNDDANISKDSPVTDKDSKIKSLTKDADGNLVVTYTDGSTDKRPLSEFVILDKQPAIEAVEKAAEAKIDEINKTPNATDDEKQAAIDKVNTDKAKALTAINEATAKDALTTAKDSGTTAIAADNPVVAKKDAAKADVETARKAKEDAIKANPNLTQAEKDAAIAKNNTAAEEATKAIDSATTNDAVDKAKEAGTGEIAKVNPVAKEAAKKAVEDVNPGSKVVVDDKGNATVTTPEGKTATIPAADVTKSAADADKANAGNVVNTPAGKVEVKDPAKLTDEEKAKVKKAVEDVNPGSKVVVDDKGNATVTTPEGKTATIPAADVTKSAADADKANAGNVVNTPAGKVEVKDPAKLTDEEKAKVKKAVEDVNPGSKVVVDDKGNATVTTPEGKTAVVPAADVTKSAADAGKANAGNAVNTPATRVLVGDKAKLTDEEKAKVKKAVEDVNPGSKVVVDDKGNATVTTEDGKTATIPAAQLVKDAKDVAAKNNGENINLDFEKETVVDFNNLTDAEKESAKAKIKGANADVVEVIFDKAGNATVITKDGKAYTIAAKDIFRQQEVPTRPGKVVVENPAKLTDAEKEAVKQALIDANPKLKDAEITIADNGEATIVYPDGQKVVIPASDLVEAKAANNGSNGNGADGNSNAGAGTDANAGSDATNGNSNAQDTNAKVGQRLANTGTTETNTGLAGLGLGILGGLLAAARRRKNDKN